MQSFVLIDMYVTLARTNFKRTLKTLSFLGFHLFQKKSMAGKWDLSESFVRKSQWETCVFGWVLPGCR